MKRRSYFKRMTFMLMIALIFTAVFSISVYAQDDDRKQDISYLLDGIKPEEPEASAEDAANLQESTVVEETTAPADPVTDNGTYTVTNLHIPAGAAYYNGHFYYYYDDPDLSWNLAFLICYTYNAHLVSITSADEQAFLEKQYPGTQGWIGASLKDDGWEWISDEPFEYTNWKEGEPNNQNGEEGYVHLYTDMKWNDLPADDTTYHSGFYCEWDSDLVTYEKNGLFDGQISEETKQLLKQGKEYYYGTGPEGYDIDKAWDCFSQATDDYSGEAWYYLGLILGGEFRPTSNPYIRAMGAFERAVTYGCQLGWFGMGNLYRSGLGVPTDYNKAMQLYKRAVDLGCEEANCGIGLLYEYGQGVEQDYSKAFECYMKAAEAGYPYAMFCVGWLYEYGQGTAQDFAMARQWYERYLECGEADIELKESVGEELAWLASENSAAAYDDYSYDNSQDQGGYDNQGVIIDYRQDGTPVYADDSYQYETQPWESPYFVGYTQDGTPQYSYDNYDYYEYETEPWESPYFVGYTQDGTPQYSYDNYDYYEYETEPWESPYFIGYTQDGTPQYSYD